MSKVTALHLMGTGKATDFVGMDHTHEASQTRCSQCSSPAQEGFSTPLCVSCRKGLSRRPVPVWIGGAAIVVSALVIYAAIAVPQRLRDITAFENAKSVVHKDPSAATRSFQELYQRYDHSAELGGWFGVASYKSGDGRPLGAFLTRFRGTKVSHELTVEITKILHETDRKGSAS